MESGNPIPLSIRSAPRLWIGSEMYWRAFWQLSTCRSIGSMGGIGPIPWWCIDRYAERLELDQESFADFEDIINAMDLVYLEEMRKANAS